jgi:uncharacterized protein YkwD
LSYARIAFATLFAGLVLCAPATAVADIPPASTAMIEKVNEMRRSSGLPTLQTSEALVTSSRNYARYMLRNDYLGHLSSIQAGGSFQFLGETLAWHNGWKPRVGHTFSQWMNSPSHKAVLMAATYRFIGAGRVRGRLGNARETAWVAQLGR